MNAQIFYLSVFNYYYRLVNVLSGSPYHLPWCLKTPFVLHCTSWTHKTDWHIKRVVLLTKEVESNFLCIKCFHRISTNTIELLYRISFYCSVNRSHIRPFCTCIKFCKTISKSNPPYFVNTRQNIAFVYTYKFVSVFE